MIDILDVMTYNRIIEREAIKMDYWTKEEVEASRLTVSIVDEHGNVVRRLTGDAAKRAEDEYMHALDVSRRMLGGIDDERK